MPLSLLEQSFVDGRKKISPAVNEPLYSILKDMPNDEMTSIDMRAANMLDIMMRAWSIEIRTPVHSYSQMVDKFTPQPSRYQRDDYRNKGKCKRCPTGVSRLRATQPPTHGKKQNHDHIADAVP